MIVVAVTDVHGHAAALDAVGEALSAADLVLLGGDLTHFGHRDDAARVVEAVRRHNPRLLAVAGNCDHPDVAAYLDDEGIGLHGAHCVVEGVAFLGVGGSLPCPVHTPNQLSEQELAALLSAAADGLDPALPWVLLSHQPPRDTAVDVVRGGMHVGSRSVREFILLHEPLVCFTGHIHEAAGTDTLGRTRLANPGPVRGGGYAWAEIGRHGEAAVLVRCGLGRAPEVAF